MSEKPQSKFSTRLFSSKVPIYLFLAILTLSVMLPISPAYKRSLYRDSGVFQYVGWLMLKGETPYQDVWDHKPPIIFLINSLGVFLGGTSGWGIWCIEFLFILGSSISLFTVLESIFSRNTALVSSFYFLFTLPYVIAGGNLTSEYSLLFSCIIIYVYFSSKISKKAKFILIGITIAVSFLTKQTTIGMGATVGMMILVDFLRKRITAKEFFHFSFHLVTGFLLGLSPFLILSLLQGNLSHFFDQSFAYNFAYSSSSIISKLNSIRFGIQILLISGLSFFSLFGIIKAITKINLKQEKRENEIYLFAVIGFIIELFLTSISGRAYRHYYLSLLPISSFCSAIFFFHMEEKIMNKTKTKPVFDKKHILLWYGIIFILLVVNILALINGNLYFPFVHPQYDPRQSQAVSFIEENSSDTDFVLLLGAETSVNFLSQRLSPSKYVYQYPLIQKGYSTEAKVTEFIDEIYSNKPRIIIDTNNQHFDQPSLNYDPKIFNNLLYSQEFWNTHCEYFSSLSENGQWTINPENNSWEVFLCSW